MRLPSQHRVPAFRHILHGTEGWLTAQSGAPTQGVCEDRGQRRGQGWGSQSLSSYTTSPRQSHETRRQVGASRRASGACGSELDICSGSPPSFPSAGSGRKGLSWSFLIRRCVGTHENMNLCYKHEVFPPHRCHPCAGSDLRATITSPSSS